MSLELQSILLPFKGLARGDVGCAIDAAVIGMYVRICTMTSSEYITHLRCPQPKSNPTLIIEKGIYLRHKILIKRRYTRQLNPSVE